MKTYRVLVEGRVGKGTFQSWAMVAATELGLTGWVRHIKDEEIEVLLQGDSEKYEKFMKRMKEESPIVDLKNISSSELDYDQVHEHFESFA